jgi:hypothetical protein
MTLQAPPNPTNQPKFLDETLYFNGIDVHFPPFHNSLKEETTVTNTGISSYAKVESHSEQFDL